MNPFKSFIDQLRDDFSGAAARAGIDPLLVAASVLLVMLQIGVIVTQVISVVSIAIYVIAHFAELLVPLTEPVWRPLGSLVLGVIALTMVRTIIRRLLAMIRAVGKGEAFAPNNVGRIEEIAGHVLGLQILGTLGRIAGTPVGGEHGASFEFGLAPAGIAFVLLLYILARVFREGAAMREDLEGTV
jgi:hypothetical protein